MVKQQVNKKVTVSGSFDHDVYTVIAMIAKHKVEITS